MRTGAGVLVAIVASLPIWSAQARMEPDPGALRLEFGLVNSTRHLYGTFAPGGTPTPLYLGFVYQGRVAHAFYLDLRGALVVPVGWDASVLGRFALVDTRQTLITIGAGPMILSGAPAPAALFVNTDATVEFRVTNSFEWMLGLSAAFALHGHGQPMCAYTCSPYLEAGDSIVAVRTGVGVRFP